MILGFSFYAWIIFVTVLVTFDILLFLKLRSDLVFLCVVGVLLITDVLDVNEALSDFNSTTMAVVGVMFVVMVGADVFRFSRCQYLCCYHCISINTAKFVMKKALYLLSLFVATVSTAQTALAQEETIVFTPQWTAQAQFAGYYVAETKGFYREAGVKVRIEHPSATLSAMSRLRNNECQATTLQLCQAMEMIDGGIPLVNILQTSMNNAMVIVSARNKDPLTLKGARVGIWSVGFGQLAICMSIKEHLNYEWVRFAQNVNLFVVGALDATLAMSYNEYYQLVQAGIKMTDKNVYRFCDHGYNVQEDGVYMTRDYYAQHREQARRFAQASRKGWEWAAEHPQEALDIVMQYVDKSHIATNRVMQRLMLQEVLRLQVDRESKKREFLLRPDMVQQASRLMVENQMLSREVTYDQLVP